MRKSLNNVEIQLCFIKMASNLGTGRIDKDGVLDDVDGVLTVVGTDDPRNFRVEDFWSKRPVNDVVHEPTASERVGANTYAVWQAYEKRFP